MKHTLPFILFAFLISLSSQSVWSLDKMVTKNPMTGEAQKTYKDIEKTLGMVPTFMKEYPAEAISGAWLDMKNLQLNSNTKLSGKDKELIGLAVAAQIPCRYCTYFHTQAAKLNKATALEINEAIAMAASTRRWSTVLYGSQADFAQFKTEVDNMFDFVNKNKNRQAMEATPANVDSEGLTAEGAYKEMEMKFGFVPTFLKSYPKDSVAGAWKLMKALDMNPDTAISGKVKDLVGIAVAAQIPCPYCTYYHTKSAMNQGATQEEINEAIAIAGMTRSWSTVLNGQYTDEKKFEGEANRIINFLKRNMAKEVTQN